LFGDIPELGVTGWARYLPEPGLDIFGLTRLVQQYEDEPVPVELDERSLVFGFEMDGYEMHGSLDTVYDPTVGRDLNEHYIWIPRWQEWQKYASKRVHAMTSYRDIVEFMADIGVLERQQGNTVSPWVTPRLLPLVEDVFELTREERTFESERRWDASFSETYSAIIRWLCDQRTDGQFLRVQVSIASLASELDLEAEDIRHALGRSANTAGDIGFGRDPERVDLDEMFKITVDWRCFDNERLILPLGLDIPS
jgi:Family of unknown function (DUF6042)